MRELPTIDAAEGGVPEATVNCAVRYALNVLKRGGSVLVVEFGGSGSERKGLRGHNGEVVRGHDGRVKSVHGSLLARDIIGESSNGRLTDEANTLKISPNSL